MRTIITLILASITLQSHAAERPNFIIVYVDDHGWADTSVRMMDSDPGSASDFHQTPHLEELARRGMRFSCAYAPSPTCTPSRKSIQFGKTPGRLGYTFVHDVLALQRKLKWKDETSRPVEGFVFHYPCYFAPPLSVIRLGDYKLMEHLLTGERKLFNVAADYREQVNLIDEEPKKALELKAAMYRYLESIDAEDIQDVYQARFAELDRFETMARSVHAKAIEQAKGDSESITKANERLAKDLARFEKNRNECRENMRGKTF